MDDFFKLIEEYVPSIMPLQNWIITFLSAFIIGGFMYVTYLVSERHEERVVSKRKMQTRHRAVLDKATEGIITGLEDQVQKGNITREEVSYIYNYIYKNCPKFKELVMGKDGVQEPSFGRPWYTGTTTFPKAKAVKDAIWNRLRTSGKSTKELWDMKKRLQLLRANGVKTAQQDQADLIAALKNHSK